MSRNRPQGTKSPERLVLHRVLINSKRFYIHTNLIKFVIAHFKFENRSMSCTFQLICIASLLAFSTFILVFMQNCRDCLFSNSEMTRMLPLNTRYRKLNLIPRVYYQVVVLLYCRVTRCRGENLGSHRQLICSIGDVFGGCTRFCVFSRKSEKIRSQIFVFDFRESSQSRIQKKCMKLE